MTDRLDLRTLNRTTLRRHSLLSRSDGSTAETVTRLMGLQAALTFEPMVTSRTPRESRQWPANTPSIRRLPAHPTG
ncbi:MAG: hypothetical protein L0Z63_06485 [Actinobacteria bacterium]|nr:hypothetical protein [Actinomycetota bacterium]